MFIKKIATMAKSPYFWIFAVVFLLQFGLAYVNREANDNHLEVVERLMQGLPVEKEYCKTCFHPKLYYFLVFYLLKIIHFQNHESLIIFLQFINVIFGIGTLVLVWFFIKGQKTQESIKRLTFALVALNAAIIGINAQITNDSLVILLSVLSTFLFWQFFDTGKIGITFLIAITLGLALSTKANGLILSLGLLSLIALKTLSKLISSKRRFSVALNLLIYTIIILPFLLFFSPYITYIKTFGTPAVLHIKKPAPPKLFEETYDFEIFRPGITSVVSGFFTFRFIDLFQYPHSANAVYYYPLHRTSFWSQMYGRSFTIHFQDWPTTWINTASYADNLTRLILLFGIIPGTIFMIGLYIAVVKVYTLLKTDFVKFLDNDLTGHVILLVLFLLFLLYMTYSYRDFSFMKPLYLYPILLTFIRLFILGYNGILNIFHKNLFILKSVNYGLIVLIMLQIFDVSILIFQLVGN